MAYDEALATRIRSVFHRKKNIEEKKMFGGVGFLLNGNMCVAVWKNSLIARIGVDDYEAALTEQHVMPFDLTGRAMKGWVLVNPQGIEGDQQLGEWIARATKFTKTLIPK